MAEGIILLVYAFSTKFSLSIPFHKYHISRLLRASGLRARARWHFHMVGRRPGQSKRHPTPGLVGSRPGLAPGSREETQIWEIRSRTRGMVGKPEVLCVSVNPTPDRKIIKMKWSTVNILIMDWQDGHNY